jgi:hypothetical protein
VVDERVVSIKLEQVEQYHGELTDKRETLSREEFLQRTRTYDHSWSSSPS